MSNILDRIDRLTTYEVHAIAADLKECPSLERIMSGHPIDHTTQAEIRTLFADHEFPISEEEVPVACQTIIDRTNHPLPDTVFSS